MTAVKVMAPMSDFIKDEESMKQKSTVADSVSGIKTCVNKLKGTSLVSNPRVAWLSSF